MVPLGRTSGAFNVCQTYLLDANYSGRWDGHNSRPHYYRSCNSSCCWECDQRCVIADELVRKAPALDRKCFDDNATPGFICIMQTNTPIMPQPIRCFTHGNCIHSASAPQSSHYFCTHIPPGVFKATMRNSGRQICRNLIEGASTVDESIPCCVCSCHY